MQGERTATVKLYVMLYVVEQSTVIAMRKKSRLYYRKRKNSVAKPVISDHVEECTPPTGKPNKRTHNAEEARKSTKVIAKNPKISAQIENLEVNKVNDPKIPVQSNKQEVDKVETDMDTADSDLIERIHDNMKMACQRLEDYGHESFLVTVSSDGHVLQGSKRGRSFLEERLSVIEDFIYFCMENQPAVKIEADIDMVSPALVSINKPVTEPADADKLSTVEESNCVNFPLVDQAPESVKPPVVQVPDSVNKPLIVQAPVRIDIHPKVQAPVNVKEPSKFVETPATRVPVKIKEPSMVWAPVSVKTPAIQVPVNVKKPSTVQTPFSVDIPPRDDGIPLTDASVSTDSQLETSLLSTDQTDPFDYDTDEFDYSHKVSDIHTDKSSEEDDHNSFKESKIKSKKKDKNKNKPENMKEVRVLLTEMKEVKILSAKSNKAPKISESEKKRTKNKESLFAQKKVHCERCGCGFKFLTHLQEHNQRYPGCQEKKTLTEAKKNEIVLQSEVLLKDKVTGTMKTKTIRELLDKTEAPFDCEVCGKSFDAYHKLKRHVFPHAKPKPYECFICSQAFNMRESLRKHMILHNTKPYHCTSCLNRYQTEEKLASHKQLCMGEILKCIMCDYEALNVNDLYEHKKIHPSRKFYAEKTTCDICGKQLNSGPNLIRHKQSFHCDVYPYKCQICGKKYKVNVALRRHRLTHGKPNHNCMICDYSTFLSANLKKHMLSHTQERPYVCDICGRQYRSKTLMDNHRRIHTGEKPYVCDFEGCDKAFRSLMNLKQHKCSHATSCAFICDICGKSFKVKGQLRHHRKDHEIEFRWPCQYCEEKFKSCDRFKNHIAKSHPDKIKDVENGSNIKFYPCTRCTRILINIEDLREHMNTHTGDKPHKCRFCNKGFSSRKNMRQHEKSHTGEQKLRCHLCPKKYSDPKAMQAHMKRIHDMEIDLDDVASMENMNNSSCSNSNVSALLTTRSTSTDPTPDEDHIADAILVNQTADRNRSGSGQQPGSTQQFPLASRIQTSHSEAKHGKMELRELPPAFDNQKNTTVENVRVQLIPTVAHMQPSFDRQSVECRQPSVSAIPQIQQTAHSVRYGRDLSEVRQDIPVSSQIHDDALLRNILVAQAWSLASAE